jgi:DNA-binding transcriptional LysR family regulator
VSRRRVLETLDAIGRPYRIAIVSSSVAVLRAAASAGLGVSAFAGYVIPDGLARLDAGLPALGDLEYVIEHLAGAARSTLALEATLVAAAAGL